MVSVYENRFDAFLHDERMAIIMDERLARIRENERKSHTKIYTNEKLYQPGSWLQRPIKTVQDIASLFDGFKRLRVLDLGCGVGRNSIYIAEQFRNIDCLVDCVDLLEIAIEKLLENAADRNVSSHINGITKAIEEYKIPKDSYDLIMAISALEHIDSQESFLRKLSEIRDGVHKDGIVCLVVNSDVEETCAETGEPMDAQFEVNLPSETIRAVLSECFCDWDVLKLSAVAQQYDIPREYCTSRLYTNVITYVARKTN